MVLGGLELGKTMAKDNVIQFPTPEKLREKERKKELEESYQATMDASFECADMSQEFLCNLEHLLQDGIISDWPIFNQMQFRDEQYPESRDVYVLVNLFNAMLNRHIGIPHQLHREFDRLFIKIKKISEEHKEIEENIKDIDVFFDPEFDLDGDDDDRD